MQKYAEEAAIKQMKQVQKNFNSHWSINRGKAGEGKWLGQNPWQDENHKEIPNFIQGIAERQTFYKNLMAKFPNNPIQSTTIIRNGFTLLRYLTMKRELSPR